MKTLRSVVKQLLRTGEGQLEFNREQLRVNAQTIRFTEEQLKINEFVMQRLTALETVVYQTNLADVDEN